MFKTKMDSAAVSNNIIPKYKILERHYNNSIKKKTKKKQRTFSLLPLLSDKC